MGTIEQTCPLLDQFLKDWCGDPRRSNRRPRLTVDEAINQHHGFKIVKLGRNDPCPCGSGKKYKKCCMR